ncbi:MAG: ABC transporter substrate-binding protein [Alphaproteobacteria bacterium]|nr:ABC transporter substrate-binding protein [Alphaproteobacteria bacterium]
MMPRVLFALTLAALAGFAPPSADAMDYVGAPSLDADVAAGKLPPVEDRLPKEPLVVDLEARGQTAGRHGGNLVTLMHRSKDTRYMYVYGYARLVKYDLDFNLVPDILKDFEVSDGGRTFTLHLREGHRWSDGHPFTTEDFLYFWEDMAHNDDLFASGPPSHMKIMGHYPKVEALDETTIRYSFPVPNPDFLPGLAQARPNQIYAPKHYLSQFHPNYVPIEDLQRAAEEAGQRNWAAVHIKANRYYRMEDKELPTLQPWYVTNEAPADRFVFKRNPYYHKVDRNGLQLPYADEVIFNIAEEKLISGKSATGDVDFQGRYLRFDDVTLLKRNEKDHGYSTFLWRIAKGSHMALYPNLTAKDPVFRKLIRDVRFRRALSLAINRREINRVIYFGLALEGQNTMLPKSPLYREEYRTSYAQFDLKTANALLDEMGLKRRWDGARIGPDGEPVEIIVETGGSTEQADILELVADSWWELGIKLYIKPLGKETLRRRIFSGQTQMTIESGFENGLATPDMAPHDLAPVTQVQYQWSEWGEYYETNKTGGAAPDMEMGINLMNLRRDWYLAETRDERAEIWHEMLQMHADQLPTIGLIAGVLQPIVVANGLRNLPEEGLWNWDPGAHFGLYGLDYVYWDKDAVTAQADQ